MHIVASDDMIGTKNPEGIDVRTWTDLVTLYNVVGAKYVNLGPVASR